jgi:nitrogen fixation protein FixH
MAKMIDTARNHQPERKSLWIPALFVGLMLGVVAVNGTMMYFAEHTFSGLDTKNPYEQGNEYNAIMKDAAASAALGWTARAAVAPTAGGHRLSVEISDKTGQPVTGLHLQVHLVRPVSTAFDQVLALKPSTTKPGTYAADVALPALGVWELRFSSPDGSTPWQMTERVFVK